ncbi:MAG: hypothetical protein BWY83_02230 [bacterium ADurb.Bin478]|nr:MAG: hypothetical protein BWY83_02230 [bacterium ADurb.Bin478]
MMNSPFLTGTVARFGVAALWMNQANSSKHNPAAITAGTRHRPSRLKKFKFIFSFTSATSLL